MTEEALFHSFCELIVREVVELNGRVEGRTSFPALTPRKVLEICLSEYYPKYFINLLKEQLSLILNNTSLFTLEEES